MLGFTAFMAALAATALTLAAICLIWSIIRLIRSRTGNRDALWQHFGCASITAAMSGYITWFQILAA